jgi:hypothetical protein
LFIVFSSPIATQYVESLRGLTGAIGLTNGNGIDLSVSGNTLTFSNGGVLSFNGLTGAVTGVTVGGTNVFTALNSFSAGISASGGTFSGDIAVNGGDITTTSATATVFNTTATTLNLGGAATTLTMGGTSGTASIRNATLRLGNTNNTITTNGGITNYITLQPYGNINLTPTSSIFGSGSLPSLVITNDFSASGQVQISGGDLYLGAKSSDGDDSFPVNIIFEGATDNANETTLTVVDPTADRTITFPDASGTVALTSGLVSSLSGSTYISVSGSTGAVTITNTGVQTFNGLTGAVTGVTLGGSNIFTALNTFNAGISASGATLSSISVVGACSSSYFTISQQTSNYLFDTNLPTNINYEPYNHSIFLGLNTAIQNTSGNVGIGDVEYYANGTQITINDAVGTIDLYAASGATWSWNNGGGNIDVYGYPIFNDNITANTANFVGLLSASNGISASGATFSGNISAPNIVNSFNGLTGAVTGVSRVNGFTGGITFAASTGITFTASAGTITLSTTGGGGSKTYAVYTPLDNQPPAANYATIDTRNSIMVLDFDAATDESAVFVGIIPEAASLGSGLKIRINWMATSATSGTCRWGVQIERMNTDEDSDSFDTAATAGSTTNATSGIITTTEITITTIDSVVAGDPFRIKVFRDADGTSGTDDMTGDAELVSVEVRSAA